MQFSSLSWTLSWTRKRNVAFHFSYEHRSAGCLLMNKSPSSIVLVKAESSLRTHTSTNMAQIG